MLPLLPFPDALRRGKVPFQYPAELAYRAPAEAAFIVDYLRDELTRRDGPRLRAATAAESATLVFASVADTPDALPPEYYRLGVTPEMIRLTARDAAGWRHAAQSLLNLTQSVEGTWQVPAVTLEDGPRFPWRGLLLDSCRTFISPAAIFRLLDQMAAAKLNRLHWHLTDDQGWRLEIKRYPLLTSIGAWRERDGRREGGFYSQDEVRAIVAHATRRGITIMPEIEMPGHATAALAAYPELGTTGERPAVGTTWGIYPHTFNAGDDRVFAFLENVLTEVMALFPGPHIHIGGDECQPGQWRDSPACQQRLREENLGEAHDLQGYFLNRIARFLLDHDRQPVAWDEVLEGPTPAGMVVECWRDASIIRQALARGHDVIAAPRNPCYFDLAVSQLDLPMVQAFDPLAGLDHPPGPGRVLGGEATLWTEYIAEAEMDHMLYPRLFGLAEALWSGPAARDPTDLLTRASHLAHRLGITPGPARRDEQPAAMMKGRTDLHVSPPGLEKLLPHP